MIRLIERARAEDLHGYERIVAATPAVARRRPRPRPPAGLVAAGLSVLAVFAGAWVSTTVFDRIPHLEDEVAYLFQARTLASGRLVADAPPHPEFFESPFIILRDDQWFGKYPLGYPAVLAVGVLAGQPWLVNPILGALSAGLVFLIGRRLYGAQTGLLAAALFVASPFFLLLAGSFMAHVASLFWALAFLLLFVLARGRRSGLAALGAGVALGMLVLSRPLTALGIALPYALWVGLDLLRGRHRLPQYLLMLAGAAPAVAALLAYNSFTTGHPLRTGYELWWPYDRLGFGEDIGPWGGHSLEKGLFHTRLNVESLAERLFGWPARLSPLPAALTTLLALVHLARRRHPPWRARLRPVAVGAQRGDRGATGQLPAEAWDLLHAGVAASLILVHVAYWYGDTTYGPRYYFEALGALALLSARGIILTAGLASRGLAQAIPSRLSPDACARAGTLLVVAVLVGHSFVHFGPAEFGRYTGWYGIDGTGVRRVQAAGPKNALVFVQGEAWTDYMPFFVHNAPSLDADVVYAIDLGDERNRDLVALYPGRSSFRYAEGRLVPLSPWRRSSERLVLRRCSQAPVRSARATSLRQVRLDGPSATSVDRGPCTTATSSF